MSRNSIRIILGILLMLACLGMTVFAINWLPVTVMLLFNGLLSWHSYKYSKVPFSKAWRINGVILGLIAGFSFLLSGIQEGNGNDLLDAVTVMIIALLTVIFSHLPSDEHTRGEESDVVKRQSGIDILCSKYQLTPREKVMVEGVYQGKTNKEIASEHYIAVSTVKKHLENIYRKLDIGNRQKLIAMIREYDDR